MPQIKKATFCYCGSHTTLRLAGKVRHELRCSNCGAPLSRMKMLPIAAARVSAPVAAPTRPQPSSARNDLRGKPWGKRKKGRYRKGFLREMVEEIWDEIEDIFDRNNRCLILTVWRGGVATGGEGLHVRCKRSAKIRRVLC